MKTILRWCVGIALRLLAALLALCSVAVLMSGKVTYRATIWLSIFSAVFYYVSRLFFSASGDQRLHRSEKPPIVYLRSFNTDSGAVLASWWKPIFLFARFGMIESDEEALARALGGIGPFVAIGQPDEWLPKLGAYRMYRGHSEWQDTVRDLLKRASLVIVRVGYTPGLLWELRNTAELVDSDRIVFWNPRSNRPNKEAFQKFLEAASEIFLVSPRANLFREPVFSLSGNAERQERIRRRNFLREIGVGFWDSFRGYLGGLKAPQLRTRFRPFVIGAGLPAPRLQVRACEPFNAAFYIVAMAAFCLFLDRPAPFFIFYLNINNMIEIVNYQEFIITCGNETVDDCTKTREIMKNIVINGDERVMIASVTLGVVLATIVMFQLVCGILVKAAASMIPFAIRLINLRPGARGR